MAIFFKTHKKIEQTHSLLLDKTFRIIELFYSFKISILKPILYRTDVSVFI